MKNRLLFWMLIIVSMSSCKKLDFNYKQFIGDGEINYVGRPDSVLLRGGDERAELSWLLTSDPDVSSYKVYWNNKQDSASGVVTKTEFVDTVRVVFDNLEEKAHEFEVYLFDKDGNSSVMASAIGRVYGPLYKRSLVNRMLKTPEVLSGNRLELTWVSPDETFLYSDIKYHNINNELITHIVGPETDTDTLPDFPRAGSFEIRSAFKPDSLAFDTFYTEYESVKVADKINMYFNTSVQYGAQANQLSVLISRDFNGIYEPESVNAATWVDITSEFDLATNTTKKEWGPKDVSSFLSEGQSFHLAFKYSFVPGQGGQRTWRIDSFTLAAPSISDVIMDQESLQFQLVHEGVFEPNRSSITPSLVLLRGNIADTSTPTNTWAISKKIE